MGESKLWDSAQGSKSEWFKAYIKTSASSTGVASTAVGGAAVQPATASAIGSEKLKAEQLGQTVNGDLLGCIQTPAENQKECKDSSIIYTSVCPTGEYVKQFKYWLDGDGNIMGIEGACTDSSIIFVGLRDSNGQLYNKVEGDVSATGFSSKITMRTGQRIEQIRVGTMKAVGSNAVSDLAKDNEAVPAKSVPVGVRGRIDGKGLTVLGFVHSKLI
jgi:hypothetical protein